MHRDRDGTAPLLPAACPGRASGPASCRATCSRTRTAIASALVWGAGAAARRPVAGAPPRCAAAGRREPRPDGGGAACGGDSRTRRTDDRDAVRLVGRAALAVPGWYASSAAPGEWSPAALGWGPLYEPHRHPAGAELGRRLCLPPGRYLLELEAEGLAPGAAPAVLDVVPGPARCPRARRAAASRADGFAASFDVRAGGARGRLATARGRPHPLEGDPAPRPTFRRLSGLTFRRRLSMRMILTGIAALAVAGAALVAAAQPGGGRGRGRHGDGPDPAVLKQELGLSDEQVGTAAEAAAGGAQAGDPPARGHGRSHGWSWSEALDAATVDEKVVAAKVQALTQLQAAALQARVDHRLAIGKLLTPEQREKMKQLRQEHRGRDRGRGAGRHGRCRRGGPAGQPVAPSGPARARAGGALSRDPQVRRAMMELVLPLPLGLAASDAGSGRAVRRDGRRARARLPAWRPGGVRPPGRAVPAGHLPALLSLRERPRGRERPRAGGVPEGVAGDRSLPGRQLLLDLALPDRRERLPQPSRAAAAADTGAAGEPARPGARGRGARAARRRGRARAQRP